MNKISFKIEVNAQKERVWNVLWRDETLREWAGIIDPGTYMVGKLKEGSEVQWISAENGYGVTSLVEKVIPNELVEFRHQADTKNVGANTRDKQWTGGTESYKLLEKQGITTLVTEFDVPDELEEYFNKVYPQALRKIKDLSESK